MTGFIASPKVRPSDISACSVRARKPRDPAASEAEWPVWAAAIYENAEAGNCRFLSGGEFGYPELP
jgi:hypothetical protein